MKGDARCQEGSEALSGRPVQPDTDRVLRQALLAVPARYFRAEHGASRPVDVVDRVAQHHGLAVFERFRRKFDEPLVELLLKSVVLGLAAVPGHAVRRFDGFEHAREVQALRLPVIYGLARVETVGPTHHFVDCPEPELRHLLAHLLGDEHHEIDDVLRLAREPLAEFLILRGHAHGAGVQVALAEHDASAHHQGSRGEAEFLGAQHAGDDDVAARFQLAIGLHHDTAAQVVLHQHLLRLGHAQFPGHARVLHGRFGRCACAAVVPADEDHVGLALVYAGRYRAHAHLGHELDVDAGPVVGALQVVYQLGQVLDGVDVVMGRRRDQPHAGSRLPHAGDLFEYLVAGQLSAFPGLGALGHLDLQVRRVDQVVAGHAETAGCHLLDGAVPPVAVVVRVVAVRVLAALARVAPAADAVHGDGQGLVGFLADRAVGHGAGGEALDDLRGRFHFLDRHRRLDLFILEEAPQRTQQLRLFVDLVRILPEKVVVGGTRRRLQQRDGLGVEEVMLAVASPLVIAAHVQGLVVRHRPVRIALVVVLPVLRLDLRQTDALDAGRGPGEVLVDDRLLQADGFEDLGAVVGLDRGDAHLGHGLQHTLAKGLEQVLPGLVDVDRRRVGRRFDQAVDAHPLHRLERQVRVDGVGPVADEQAEVHDLARFARLHHDGRAGP